MSWCDVTSTGLFSRYMQFTAKLFFSIHFLIKKIDGKNMENLPCFELYWLPPQRTTYVRRLGGIVRTWRCYFEHKTKRQYFIAFGSVWSWICPKIIVWFRKTPTQSPQNWSLKMKKKHQKCLDETILWCSDICPYVDSELLRSLFVSTLRLLVYFPNSPQYISKYGEQFNFLSSKSTMLLIDYTQQLTPTL